MGLETYYHLVLTDEAENKTKFITAPCFTLYEKENRQIVFGKILRAIIDFCDANIQLVEIPTHESVETTFITFAC